VPELDAGAFAFVMATGIVSVAAGVDGLEVVSDVLLVAGCAAWLALGVLVGMRLLRSPRGRPRLQSFAVVAATDVLGVRFVQADAGTCALALWCVAVVLWLALLVRRPILSEPVAGALLLVVGTESLAVLAALLAYHRSSLFLVVALLAWSLGLLLYPLVIAAIAVALRRRPRFMPELWVVMGALAITTLAGTDLLVGVRVLRAPSWLRGFPLDVDLATWALATVLLLPLVAVEIAARAHWRYTASRWSFVFPLGMYAVASDTLGRAAGFAPLRAVGGAFLAVALLAWAATCTGLAVNTARRAADHSR
jgi:tellurite resistance protein TehA-like permease